MTRFGVWCVSAVTTGAVMVLASVGAVPTSASPGVVPAGRVAAAPTPTCGGERPVKPGGGRYDCSFEDDFSGRTLDPTKWVVTETATTGLHAGITGCYVNRPQNVLVANGMLNLASRLERFACKQPFGGTYNAKSTAGTVTSTTRFAQTYGRFEFRARFPSVRVAGSHSALWLYPQEHSYGRWPHSGEVDVAEWFSARPTKVYPSVHYAGENKKGTGHDCTVPTATTGYHRYAVEWTPTTMRFLYDGKACHIHSWIAASPMVGSRPFDKPFYLVMTQVMGLSWNAVSAMTPAVSNLQIDWVRVWR
ncbi:glycoside hydrolase family 16 protein [Nocardioides sp. WS12]|uniref:glycoside hydrolase family 16 protein n=1 Tax=Nocardioides sp. WS12 TaxID=2486272 RepID=UPI0015FBED4E|nr:glycoside hydrolase family 16 protein [Nocardioides sp. WS12]